MIYNSDWYKKQIEDETIKIKQTISIFLEAENLFKEGRYKEAAEKYRLAAIPCDAESEYNWGVVLFNGIDGKKDYGLAQLFFEKAAQKGYSSAEKILAIMYYKGIDEIPDYEKAYYYAQKAAENGIIDGYFILGLLYYFGNYVDNDYEKSFFYFNKSISSESDYNRSNNLNFKNAYYILGFMCYHGQGHSVDYFAAREYLEQFILEKSSESSYNSDAMMMLGKMYILGQGGPCDFVKSYNCFLKSEEIENNNESEYWLGILSFIFKDKKKEADAYKWLEKSAEKGNTDAVYYLSNEVARNEFLKKIISDTVVS